MATTLADIRKEVCQELSQYTSCVPLSWKLECMWSSAVLSGRKDKADYIWARIHRLRFEEIVLGKLID